MSGERMFSRGNASFKASDPTDEKQYPSRPLPYKRSVEEYFFGPPNPAKTLRVKSAQKSKSSTTINRILHNTSHGPVLEQVEGRNQRGNKTASSKATFRWIKGDLIGSGSHGKVYLGLNVNTGEVMAVKQVELPETTSDRMKDNMKKIVEAIKDERETLKDLDHGNIVQYLGFEENRETLNIFLQYVSGGTIGSCLRQHGIFREEVTKHFATQILEGLTYLHAQGIIHRDLKSENILVEESGVCKISDFGISKKLAELDSRAFSMMKGTSYWMAPEVICDGGKGYDTKIDIWSVGCILFEMWTAKRPWYNQEFLPVFHKLITDRSSPPMPEDCHLSPIAEDFRKRCFHSDPRERPSASLLLMHHYLDLPTGWSFPGMSNMGFQISTNPRTGDTEMADVVQMMSRSININALGSQRRSPSPALSTRSEILNVNPPSANHPAANPLPNNLPRPPRPRSPPLVIIEPPGPRKHKSKRSTDWMVRERSSSWASESSGSQRSSQAESRTARQLVIHNPDNNDNEHPKSRPDTTQPTPYVYVPPPLPEIGGAQVPYSANLAPLPQTRFIDPIPSGPPNETEHRRSNSKTSNAQYQSSLLAAPRQFHGNYTRSNLSPAGRSPSRSQTSNDDRLSDSDSDYSASSSTWKKPPAGIANSVRYLSKKVNAAAQQQQVQASGSMPNRARKPSLLGETRPAVREVLERLENFFPDHNLDEPVTNMVDSKRYTMKSVKAIAEEQMSSPVRRQQTRLWDKRVEEIKAP